MNEQELIRLWKSGGLREVAEIDFEGVSRKVKTWQKRLHRKIELDILMCVIMTTIFLVFSYFDPRALLFLPILNVAFIWYYRALWKMYKHESSLGDFSSTKEFLDSKNRLLADFVRKNRVFGPIAVPLAAFASLLLVPEYDSMFTDPTVGLATIAVVLVATVLGTACIEILLRILYVPVLDRLKELLEQMEE